MRYDESILQGGWDEVKGKLKEKYNQLTDDDLGFVEGKEDELLGRLGKTDSANQRKSFRGNLRACQNYKMARLTRDPKSKLLMRLDLIAAERSAISNVGF
jgi:uncharacterized protein YjbJ (UPF0337 family)